MFYQQTECSSLRDSHVVERKPRTLPDFLMIKGYLAQQYFTWKIIFHSYIISKSRSELFVYLCYILMSTTLAS